MSDAVDGVDVVVHVVDAASGVGRGDAYVSTSDRWPQRTRRRACAINKIDRRHHHEVVPQLAAVGELGTWDEVVPISAVGGIGVDTLRDLLVGRMPEGPALFPDEVTDQPVDVRIAELVREQPARGHPRGCRTRSP